MAMSDELRSCFARPINVIDDHIIGGEIAWNAIDEDTHDHFRDNAPKLCADLGMAPYEIDAAGAARIATPTLVLAGSEGFPALHQGAHPGAVASQRLF